MYKSAAKLKYLDDLLNFSEKRLYPGFCKLKITEIFHLRGLNKFAFKHDQIGNDHIPQVLMRVLVMKRSLIAK